MFDLLLNRKGNKSKQGAGHLWVLADFDDDQEERQPVMNNSTPCIEDEDEAARAGKRKICKIKTFIPPERSQKVSKLE